MSDEHEAQWQLVESNDEIGTVVPFVRGDRQSRHDEETKTRAMALFCTLAGRNCRAVADLLAEEMAGTGLPVPTRQTIAVWAREERWADYADEQWRTHRGRTLFEMQVIAASNALLGQKRRQDVLLGKYAGDKTFDGALMLKAAADADKALERVYPVGSIKAPDLERETIADQTRDEREAKARAALVPGKKEAS